VLTSGTGVELSAGIGKWLICGANEISQVMVLNSMNRGGSALITTTYRCNHDQQQACLPVGRR
jgi:hypothetical protein